MNDLHPIVQQAVQDRLDTAYRLTGRDDPAHPMHCLYTDLAGELQTKGITIDGADVVKEPLHYRTGEIECIDAIRAALGPDGFTAYCEGNVLKYCWRWKFKGGVEDLRKAQVYLEWMIQSASTSS